MYRRVDRLQNVDREDAALPPYINDTSDLALDICGHMAHDMLNCIRHHFAIRFRILSSPLRLALLRDLIRKV